MLNKYYTVFQFIFVISGINIYTLAIINLHIGKYYINWSYNTRPRQR